MAFTLAQIVPWGRNLAEYKQMFRLSGADLDKKILGCGDGPASFNAELYHLKKQCVSLDPIYQFSATEIEARIQEVVPTIAEQVTLNYTDFNWQYYRSPEELVQIRLQAMKLFLQDFAQGKASGRYIAGELPLLPFSTGQFDLVLCSHLLFSYSYHLDYTFHVKAIQEMNRVGREIRIFPLLKVNGEMSEYVNPLITELKRLGMSPRVVEVPYEFQKKGNQMLQINAIP